MLKILNNKLTFFAIFIAVFLIYVALDIDGEKCYLVTEIVDGDTIRIKDGLESSVRYLGIDTPEILTEFSPGDPFGSEAGELNKKLVNEKRVCLEFDKERYDPYGRILAYVYVDGLLVNEELVKKGLARSLIFDPNRKFEDRIKSAENLAKNKRLGIWGDLKNYPKIHKNSKFLIKPANADRFVGERVVVRGKINGYRKSEKVLVLKMEEGLNIVVFPDTLKYFHFFGIEPEKKYIGIPVEVTGKVKMYKGRPEIIIRHPYSIRSLS